MRPAKSQAGDLPARAEPNPLARAAMLGELDPESEEIKALAPTADACKLAVAAIADQSRPLQDLYPGFKSLSPARNEQAMTDASEIVGPAFEGLKMVGRSIMALASADQARNWMGALVVKLSDYPPAALLPAIRDARHVRISEPWMVETVIADLADQQMARFSLAKRRLEKLEADLARIPPAKPLAPTSGDWEDFNAHMRSLGLKSRYFAEEIDPKTDTPGRVRAIESDDPDPAPNKQGETPKFTSKRNRE